MHQMRRKNSSHLTVQFDKRFLISIYPFDIETKDIEKSGGIVWLKMAENSKLMKIHNDLVDLLQAEFGIAPHDFDRAYLFHATLYMCKDTGSADEAYAYLKNEYFPDCLVADKLVIGCSQTGHAGEYQVIKTFELKNNSREDFLASEGESQ